jgi:predicted transcriptional regulator
MSVPCEVAVKCVLPVVRAMIAKELTETHQLKQAEAAGLLGVSQPAISLYHRRIRGKAINLDHDQDVQKIVTYAAESLAKNHFSHSQLSETYCKVCRTVRAKGLLCELHKAFDPSISIEECELCFPTNSADVCRARTISRRF